MNTEYPSLLWGAGGLEDSILLKTYCNISLQGEKKKKKKKNLSVEVGPDHYFHVVPAVSKSSLLLQRWLLTLSWGLPSACRSVSRCPHVAILLTDHAPYPCGLLTCASRSIPPVVHSLTMHCTLVWASRSAGDHVPISGKLPEARLFTPRTGVVRFHSPQTSTQTVWPCTPADVFGRPSFGTVL